MSANKSSEGGEDDVQPTDEERFRSRAIEAGFCPRCGATRSPRDGQCMCPAGTGYFEDD